jgi:uncharacterized protein GlcG (DUF336 family)
MPLEFNVLGLEEGQKMIEAAMKYTKANDLPPMAIVVADKAGKIIASARMNGASPRYIDAAHRKAYTAAIFERDTLGLIEFWGNQERQGHRGPHDWNDRMFTSLPGGLVVCHGQRGGNLGTWDVVGGIGVAGDDEKAHEGAVASAGLEALGEGFRHRGDWS